MNESALSDILKLADGLNLSDRLALIEQLASGLRRKGPAKPARSLRGIWKDKVPEDFDIDGALREIRGEQPGGEKE